MKSNDDFSLDKENIVGKTVRKERKCFAAGCISALCLLFTIPAPFLSTWTDRLSARQHRKLLLRAMLCYVFLFFAFWQNYKVGKRFIARQPHKVDIKMIIHYYSSPNLSSLFSGRSYAMFLCSLHVEKKIIIFNRSSTSQASPEPWDHAKFESSASFSSSFGKCTLFKRGRQL